MPSQVQENFNLVEGEFKNVVFNRIVESDYERVWQHIQDYFLKDEITCKTLGVTPECLEEFQKVCRIVMDFKMSFMAEDKDTNEVAAVRLTYRFRKDVNPFANLTINSYLLRSLLYMFGKLNDEANLFEKYGITEYAELFMMSTGTKYRNQGLAKEFYTRSLAFLKAEGFHLAKVFVTSPWTKAATKSLNFIETGEIKYPEAKDENGKLIFNPEKVQDISIICKIYLL